jgi:septum site-determining protein MinD
MLAIASGKGGAGTTTTAIGLAGAVEGRSLVVDADVDMPDLHALAGVARSPTVTDVTAEPLGSAQRAGDGVEVLPAPTATDRSGRSGGESGITAALARCRSADAPVLVDCPSGAGPDAAAPLRAVDATLLVSPACAPALQDAAKTAAIARALDADPVGAVLTRTRFAPEAVADLLGCPIVGVVPEVEPPVLDREPVREAYRRAVDRLGLGLGRRDVSHGRESRDGRSGPAARSRAHDADR